MLRRFAFVCLALVIALGVLDCSSTDAQPPLETQGDAPEKGVLVDSGPDAADAGHDSATTQDASDAASSQDAAEGG